MIPPRSRPKVLGNSLPQVALHINRAGSVWSGELVRNFYGGPPKKFGIRGNLKGLGGCLLRCYSGLRDEVGPALAHAATSTYNFHAWIYRQTGYSLLVFEFRGT